MHTMISDNQHVRDALDKGAIADIQRRLNIQQVLADMEKKLVQQHNSLGDDYVSRYVYLPLGVYRPWSPLGSLFDKLFARRKSYEVHQIVRAIRTAYKQTNPRFKLTVRHDINAPEVSTIRENHRVRVHLEII